MNLPGGYSLQNGKYQLTKVIGQGGFGITYLGVWHTDVKGNLGTVRTEVPVCIKEYFFKDYCFRDEKSSHVLIHSETGKILFDKFKEKLIKEAKILSDVHHPYIVNVLEVFEENNTAYIAMEHISGCSLKYMLDVEGILPENKVLRYMSQIGQALDFVHQKNILHLDIKPSNILIDKKNNARLIDFGVSKRYDIEQQETSTTMLTLSKGFAPIEQYDDEGTQSFSPCPDVYSLGATMYNLLTGEIPIESILRVTKPLVKPSDFNRAITPQTETAILTAMQVNPIHRYQSVKAMINELDIPSYFEDTPNLLIENTDYLSQKDEEGTELYSESSTSQPVDDEQTQIRQDEIASQHIRKRKRKRRILIPALIFIFAFLSYGVAYLLELNGTRGAEQPVAYMDELTDAAPENQTDETISIANADNTSENQTVESNRPSIDAIILQENPTAMPTDDAPAFTPEMIEAAYDSLLITGKAKMEGERYADAIMDFRQAEELKPAYEVARLIVDCEDKAKVKEISERKALYRTVTSFGNLTIVMKWSNERYGAIDNEGIEQIPCVYINIGRPTDRSRMAFEREEDNKYDIYRSNGEQVGFIQDGY